MCKEYDFVESETCPVCKGRTKLLTTKRHSVRWKGKEIIFRDITYVVCEDCGSDFFTKESDDRIDKFWRR